MRDEMPYEIRSSHFHGSRRLYTLTTTTFDEALDAWILVAHARHEGRCSSPGCRCSGNVLCQDDEPVDLSTGEASSPCGG